MIHSAATKIKFNLPLLIVLLLALCLRLANAGTMSLSNDELSSIWRSIHQPSWHDMMVYGVMPDGHPSLTYIVLRLWGFVFGDSALSVRVPFIIAGVAGLYFTYRTGVIWFGRIAALLSISLLAATAYPIYYHQIARPYALGFLWVQAAAFFWTRYFFDERWRGHLSQLGLWALMAILCCYTHYFSLMAAGLMALTGLFFVDGSTLRPYIISGFIIIIALIPGAAIFARQLSYGGLSWLPAPDHDWLPAYFAYALNNSRLLYFTVALLVTIPLVAGVYHRRRMLSKFQLIGISWFVISFAVGYLKSVYSMPVLQASCLVFTFPFLVLAVFSLWGDNLGKRMYTGYIAAALLFSVSLYGLVIRDHYYSYEHHGEFKGLATQMAAWTDRYGSDMIRVINVNNRYYWEYYWMEHLHRAEPVALYSLETDADMRRLDSLLWQSPQSYIGVAWSNRITSAALFPVVERHYPRLLETPQHFNSGIRLYSK